MTSTVATSTTAPPPEKPRGFPVRFAVLCDYASVTNDNKLNLLGLFSELHPPFLPFQIAQMFVVVVYDVPQGISLDEKVSVGLDLIDPNQASLFHIEQMLEVDTSHQAGSVTINHVIGLGGLAFPVAGDYRFRIKAGFAEDASVKLVVHPVGEKE